MTNKVSSLHDKIQIKKGTDQMIKIYLFLWLNARDPGNSMTITQIFHQKVDLGKNEMQTNQR